MNRLDSFHRREKLLSFLALFGFLLIVGQLVRIQLVGHNFWQREARQQELTWVKQQPLRGDILDRMGRPLAISLPLSYAVGYRPRMCADKNQLSKLLRPLLSPVHKDWKARLNQNVKFTYLARRVDWQTAQKLRALNLPCLELSEEPRRSYPCRALAASVIGCTGIDENGQEGIEYEFDSELRGQASRQLAWIDSRGKSYLPVSGVSKSSAAGADIQLTIDVALQTIVEEELQKAMQTQKCLRACILLTNPQTGEILALTTYPRFDPNQSGRTSPEARRCWPITDCMEHGSTLKILPFAAALSSNLFASDEQVFCEKGKFPVSGIVIHDAHQYGYLSFAQVFQKSSNIGTVKIARRLGKRGLYEMARDFGLGTPTGISFPGEQACELPPLHKWSGATLANIAFGQGVSATPLQIVMAYGAIANGGYLMKPLIVRRIYRASGEIEENKPSPIRQVLSTSVARSLSQLLVGVVESGTGQVATIPGWRIAGKTGTAQKVDLRRHQYFKDRFVSSFIGFAPADAPSYLMLVLVDEPQGEHYGAQVAAPIFRDAMARILECKPPSFPESSLASIGASNNQEPDDSAQKYDEKSTNAPAFNAEESDVVVFSDSANASVVRVPPVEGLSLRRAIRELTARSLAFDVTGGSEVICQSPPAGVVVPVGTVCYLYGQDH
jgi:cell division protein FtsI (penicillin-binding protein 3)